MAEILELVTEVRNHVGQETKMHENEVSNAVSKWLSSLLPFCVIHTDNDEMKVYEVENGYSVGYKLTYYIRVRCKEELAECYRGLLAECYRDLGRCLTYCIENDYIRTYLAIPHDCPNKERLERTVNAVKLPIGLLMVGANGEVRVVTKPHTP